MDPLSQLHDILLPKAISGWSLAVGWYVLLILVICMVLAVFFFCRAWWQARFKRFVLRELSKADCRAASVLLRRAALHCFDQKTVAGLQGKQWLAFLDETGGTTQFTQGVGSILLHAPYQSGSVVMTPELVCLIVLWIKRNL